MTTTVETFIAPECIRLDDGSVDTEKMAAALDWLNDEPGLKGGWSAEPAGWERAPGFWDAQMVTVRSRLVNPGECFRNACYALFQPSFGQP